MSQYRLKTHLGFVTIVLADGPEDAARPIVYDGEAEAIALIQPYLQMAPTDRGALGESCTSAQFETVLNGDWMRRYQPKMV